MGISLVDEGFIQQTFELAEKGIGKTSPNPLVGCIITKNNKLISQGYHHKFGDKHAEIDAIDNAQESLENSTLYCNLEPCCNNIPNKKTPPCTNRIIKEKIKKVVIASKDPNPFVSGKGIKELQNAGIEVVCGVKEKEALQLNESYIKHIQTGLPFVHLKIAQTIDGRIATSTGNSQWITNERCLDYVQELRNTSDAILVGINTVLKDNPHLTQRKYSDNQPYRIVLDENLLIPLNSNLLADKFSKRTIIFTSNSVFKTEKNKIKTINSTGAQVKNISQLENGNLNLKEVLQELGNMQINNLMVEGGAQIFTAFIKNRMANKITIFMAPKIVGMGIETIGDLNIKSLQDCLEFKTDKIEEISGQIMWTIYPV